MTLTDEQNSAKNVGDGEEVLLKVIEETPGNPWKPLGHPSGHPFGHLFVDLAGTSPEPHRQHTKTRPRQKQFRHLAGLETVPNLIPRNIA